MSDSERGSGRDWDDARKAALFADIVGLKLSVDEAARAHGLSPSVIEDWLHTFRRSALLAFDERLKKTLLEQGASPEMLRAAEFTGHLERVSIADLVQTIELAGKDAVISVSCDGEESRLWCAAGCVVDAESGRLSGEAAAFRILAFERGQVVADLRPEPRTRTIHAATHRLLLEALRRKDEAAQLERSLGGADRLYRVCDRPSSSRVHVSTGELSLLRVFDGPRRLGDVIAQSRLGDIETLRALHRLVSGGYLVATDAPAPAQRGADARRSGSTARERRATKKLARQAALLPARDGQDVPSSPTSFVPVAMTHTLERAATRPRWVSGAIATAVLAPAAFWLGEAAFNWRRTPEPPLAGAPTAALAHPLEPASAVEPALESTFSVSTRVEPEGAVLWLDGHRVASGVLNIVLARDGRTHELRASADGHVPATLLFADVPPPATLRLEPLPATAAGSPAGAARLDVPASTAAGPAGAVSGTSANAPTPASAPEPASERGLWPRSGAPVVQVTHETTPHVHVIE